MGLQELSGLDPSYVIATITLKPALEQLRRKVARKKRAFRGEKGRDHVPRYAVS